MVNLLKSRSKNLVLPVLLLALVSACSIPTNITTPQGKTAYSVDQLVNSLGVFQDAAIGANTQKLLSDSHTKLVVTYVKSAVITAQQAPNGWQATLTTGLNQLKLDLGTDATSFQSIINLIESIIAELA